MYSSCCFTGHRELQPDFDYALTERVIENLIRHGTHTFYCGMAKGFDMAVAEMVIALKATYPAVKLIACIPYRDHPTSFGKALRERYARILSACDERFVLSEYYDNGCMLRRDQYMVERSQVVLCYLRKSTGGTAYTVKYAKSIGLPVIEV